MFKISTIDTRSQRTLVVEGTLIGSWVAELRTTWRTASQELGGRRLVVDLSNLTVISLEGENAIFHLMKEGAEFSRGGILIRHVLKQLARKKQRGPCSKTGASRAKRLRQVLPHALLSRSRHFGLTRSLVSAASNRPEYPQRAGSEARDLSPALY